MAASGAIAKRSKRQPSVAQIAAHVAREQALLQARMERKQAELQASMERRTAALAETGVSNPVTVSSRMSSKGFASKDPKVALQVLQLVNIDGMADLHTFDSIGIHAYKVHAEKLADRLVCVRLYPTLRASRLAASQALRYVYEMAQTSNGEDITKHLCWQTCQQSIQGKETRGTGIVALNTDAKGALTTALSACIERVVRRVAAAAEYEKDMLATATGAVACA